MSTINFVTHEDKTHNLHIRDAINHISKIVILDDITKTPTNFNKNLIEDNADNIIEYTDDELLKLPKEEIAEFRNPILLKKLFELDKDLLSDEQKKLVKQYLKTTFVIDAMDVKKVLGDLQSCTNVLIYSLVKSGPFMSDYELDYKDVLCIVKDLKVSDYISNTRSFWEDETFAHELLVFEPTFVELPNGRKFDSILLYLKLDLDGTTGTTAALMSIHPSEYFDDIHPYKDTPTETTVDSKEPINQTTNNIVNTDNIKKESMKKGTLRFKLVEEFEDELLENLPEVDSVKKYLHDNCGRCKFFEVNGVEEVVEFIESQPNEIKAKICFDMTKLNGLGSKSRPPLSKKLSKNIYELRTKIGTDIARNLYFFYIDDDIVFTNGFIKKTNDTPKEELIRAERRRVEYIKSNNNGGKK